MLFNFKNKSKKQEDMKKEEENVDEKGKNRIQEALQNLPLTQVIDILAQSIDKAAEDTNQAQNEDGKALFNVLKDKSEQLINEKKELEKQIEDLQQQIKDQEVEHVIKQRKMVIQNQDDMKKAKLFANADIIESIIVEFIDNVCSCQKILDNFKDTKDEDMIPISEAYKSLQMSIDNVHNKLSYHKVLPIVPEKDSKYDPNEHQIISNVCEKRNESNQSMPLQRVLSVLQHGYKIEQENDKRVIRTAKVTTITLEE